MEELDELLQLVEFKNETDRLVFLGDIIDRGPDPLGCIRRVRELIAECLLGNHEEKCARWFRHEDKRNETGKPNPMRWPGVDRLAQWKSFSTSDIEWMRKLPSTIEIGDWIAVHAGLEPGRPLNDQRPDRIIRVRFVDEKTEEMVPYEDGHLEQPKGTVYWTDRWKGPKSVVFGHAVHSLKDPRINLINSDRLIPIRCVGLDTGCCFGGRLTAMILEDGKEEYLQFAQIRAKKEYHPPLAC